MTTENGELLLDLLTHKTRVFSVAQIARSIWPELRGAAGVCRQLRALEVRGLVICFRAEVHPELPLSAPVFSWFPGCRLPDFAVVSHRLRNRWTEKTVSTQCVIASTSAGRLHGGWGGRFPRESEETHDLHLSAVYLRLHETNPEAAARWISEETIRLRRGSRSEKLPDALIDDPTSPRIVEFGGAYKKKKLEAFHGYCSELGLPYEVW